MSTYAVNLFSCATELFLNYYKRKSCLSDLYNCKNSILSMASWSLLIKISIDESDVVTAAELEVILRMAYNMHILNIDDDSDILICTISYNHDNLRTHVNQQVKIYIKKKYLIEISLSEISTFIDIYLLF